MIIKRQYKTLSLLFLILLTTSGIQARRKKVEATRSPLNTQQDTPTTKVASAKTSKQNIDSSQQISESERVETGDGQAPEILNAQDSSMGTIPDSSAPVLAQEKTGALPAPQTSGDDEKADIYLNFENTELGNFINYIAELKKINIVPDKGIPGNKISLTIRKPLTPTGAWNVFHTINDMAGFSMIKSGDVYKVVQKNQKIRQPLPSYINVPLETLPDNDSTIRYVTFLNNINVGDVKDLLSNMLGQPSLVIDQPNVNGFIITAKSFDIKAAMKVIHELDQTGLQESVVVVSLKQANAKEVKDLFSGLMSQPSEHPLARLLGKQAENTTSYFSPTTKIIADERTNRLILLGNIQSIEKIENFIKEHIDTELKEVKSPLRIYELQHTDAEQIAEILSEVANPQNLDTEAGQNAAKYGHVRGGVKFFKSMKFKVDKEANRLIVSSADDQDWELLKKTIQDLDKAQPQIALETLVVQVSVTDNKQIGAQLRNKRHGLIGKDIDFQAANLSAAILNPPSPTSSPQSLLGNMLSSVTGAIGQTILSFGNAATGGVWGALQILKTLTNTTVLSQPFITIANKAKGSISVGESRRIVSQTAVSDTGSITTNSASGFETKQVATTINVTPQINIDGVVKLELDISLSTFKDDTGATLENALKTYATVADGQVLVLGGFVQTQVSDSENKTPVLSDIPLLGWLFKSKIRAITKSYIFVFMCPTIVKPRTTPGMDLYSKIKLHDATNEIEDAIETRRTKDPIHNWFFNGSDENYSHKVVDYANARYQPTTVDIANDPYYRSTTRREEMEEETLAKKRNEQKRSRAISGKKKAPSVVEVAQQPSLGPTVQTQIPVETPKALETNAAPAPSSTQETPLMAKTPLDIQIEEQRKKLKDLLAQNQTTTQEKAPNSNDKASQLKEFIATQPEVGA